MHLLVGVAGASIHNNKNLQKFCSCNFCDFSNCLFSYSPCADALAYPATPPYQNKKHPKRGVFISGGSGWIRTSSGLSQQIYSLPRLSNSGARPNLSPRILVAVPHETLAKCGAGSGNRTRISSLEGLHTSLCTMPATNSKPCDYILNENKIKRIINSPCPIL